MSIGDYVSLFGKILPFLEHIVTQVGPLAKAEEEDIKMLWTDFEHAFTDLKIAFQAVQTVVPPAPPPVVPPNPAAGVI